MLDVLMYLVLHLCTLVLRRTLLLHSRLGLRILDESVEERGNICEDLQLPRRTT